MRFDAKALIYHVPITCMYTEQSKAKSQGVPNVHSITEYHSPARTQIPPLNSAVKKGRGAFGLWPMKMYARFPSGSIKTSSVLCMCGTIQCGALEMQC